MTKKDLSQISFAIRNSLNAICGISALLCAKGQDAIDERRELWAQIINSECRRLADFSDSILLASNLDEVKNEPNKNQIDLWSFAHKVIADSDQYIKDGSDIVYTTTLDIDFEFSVNAPLLEIVLVELIKNALASTNGGHVILRTETDENRGVILFSVSDCGSGIPAEHRERIFDWFYKIDPYSPGLGIGLPLCREIATILNGEITLDKTSFSGTKVLLSIPYITDLQ